MPQFNITLFYFIINIIVFNLFINYIIIFKKSLIVMNFFYKRKIHLINKSWNSLLTLVVIVLNVNNNINKLFIIMIKVIKLNIILNKIKNVNKINIFKLYNANKFFYLLNLKNYNKE